MDGGWRRDRKGEKRKTYTEGTESAEFAEKRGQEKRKAKHRGNRGAAEVTERPRQEFCPGGSRRERRSTLS